jgi:hypothetical protein
MPASGFRGVIAQGFKRLSDGRRSGPSWLRWRRSRRSASEVVERQSSGLMMGGWFGWAWWRVGCGASGQTMTERPGGWGRNWPLRLRGSPPAAVATRTGLAIVYVTVKGTVRFWHGSVERLVGEDLVPSAQRLDAPPDEVQGVAVAAGLRIRAGMLAGRVLLRLACPTPCARPPIASRFWPR